MSSGSDMEIATVSITVILWSQELKKLSHCICSLHGGLRMLQKSKRC